MQGHLFAVLAEFFYFQPFRVGLLIFSGMIIEILANRAFQTDEIILGHCFPVY